MTQVTHLPRIESWLFCALFLPLVFASSVYAQGHGVSTGSTPISRPVNVNVSVRDARGFPLESPALVRLHSSQTPYDVKSPTREASIANFTRVMPGEYEIEVNCLGYKTATERVSVTNFGADVSVFVYVHPETEDNTASPPPSGIVMTPKLENEIDKGLGAMRKQEYETARSRFQKAEKLAPSNADVAYLLGTSELALQHTDLARNHFEAALKSNPSHQRALLALGELQMQAGQTSAAIATLEKAFDVNGADWRTHLLLASAYAKDGRLAEAEAHAERAANLAQQKGAFAAYLLGEIQYAEGKWPEAKASWELVVAKFPDDPMAPKAKEKLLRAAVQHPLNDSVQAASLPPPLVLAVMPAPVVERPWAPGDIDSTEYRLASDAPCQSDDVLARAYHRMRAQMGNFEKFTATERIEHQEIDRYGMPGPPRTREFSYIVFVHPFKEHSVYLEESRTTTSNATDFPTSLATTGLNGLGVSLLQPAFQVEFVYKCEGLTSLRGKAAWQIRFEENMTGVGAGAVREWRKNGLLYDIPIKGRIWVAASSFDLLRVETDLINPIEKLELTRDHLTVDYGPVSFQNGAASLWLPWSAEMYMELHGKRYHHKHFLTDYLLFEVDTSNKIRKPKDPPPVEADPTS